MGIFDFLAKQPHDPASLQTIKQRDSMRRNGFKEYTFHANRDCCPICAAMDGKHFPVAGLKIGINAPPMHEKCRCSISAYEDQGEYEAWLDHLANGGTTASNRKKAKKR